MKLVSTRNIHQGAYKQQKLTKWARYAGKNVVWRLAKNSLLKSSVFPSKSASRTKSCENFDNEVLAQMGPLRGQNRV